MNIPFASFQKKITSVEHTPQTENMTGTCPLSRQHQTSDILHLPSSSYHSDFQPLYDFNPSPGFPRSQIIRYKNTKYIHYFQTKRQKTRIPLPFPPEQREVSQVSLDFDFNLLSYDSFNLCNKIAVNSNSFCFSTNQRPDKLQSCCMWQVLLQFFQ